ncbi:MAG: acetylglutamate kinase [Oscillospiraceae bacterium]|jgi:acetylglutamate kinase|nr:acetylglutamate kinase [Oscillospiraceae bacterium]
MQNIGREQRAQILVEALPYIQKYHNKIVVIKYGGAAMLNEALKRQVMGDIALLHLVGIRVVLVHGGGPEISDLLNRMGKRSEFIDGLRVTDRETAEVVTMVLAGKINKGLVALMETFGRHAIGLSGLDGQMIMAAQKEERLGFVGNITSIDPSPIETVLEHNYIPIISTLGCDANGNVYNINADTAAARIAAALGAESLISMSDIPGLLRDVSDENSLISKVSADEVPVLEEQGVISGGMIPKVDCCVEALRGGVRRVFILDGRVEHSILIEVLTDAGIGTMFTNESHQAQGAKEADA